MTRYLLDTNILSDLVRNPQGMVARRITSVGETSVCTSVIVTAELRFGAAKRGSDRLRRQLDRILTALDVLAFDTPADVAYAELRVELEAVGTPIGGNDMMIAAHALATDSVLVTANVREFERVERLTLENWLR